MVQDQNHSQAINGAVLAHGRCLSRCLYLRIDARRQCSGLHFWTLMSHRIEAICLQGCTPIKCTVFCIALNPNCLTPEVVNIKSRPFGSSFSASIMMVRSKYARANFDCLVVITLKQLG